MKDFIFIIKKDRRAKISVIILVVLTLLSIFAFLSPYDPNGIDISARLKAPSLDHPFGTDDMGRDYLTRALYGGRVSLSVGFSAMIISCFIGTLVGAISGYFGGWIDSIIMRTLDILMCIPSFFIILILNIYLKPGLATIVIIIALFSWMNIARIVRSETLSIKERDYVVCAESQGICTFRIIRKHIIPNVMNTVLVAATINVASAIITESSLSFLGLGVQAPTSSWGSMLQNAQSQMMDRPTLAIFPGLLILLTVLSFNMLGDRFRDNIKM